MEFMVFGLGELAAKSVWIRMRFFNVVCVDLICAHGDLVVDAPGVTAKWRKKYE